MDSLKHVFQLQLLIEILVLHVNFIFLIYNGPGRTSKTALPSPMRVSGNLNPIQIMTSKRVFGFVFIFLASLLTLAIVGQLPALFGAILGFLKIFTGKLDGYQIGEVIGRIIYWLVHFIVTIALWKYGVRWLRKQDKVVAMTKFASNWRNKSLETLENHNWGNPTTAPTNLVKRCIELSKISIDNFTLGDLRVMIGQKFGLRYLIPLAIEKLQDNIFVSAELYEGDLLENVLKIDTSFWDNNENYWIQLNDLIKSKRQEIIQMKITLTNFDNSKFAKGKGRH